MVHCGTLWYTVIHCGTLWYTEVNCDSLRYTVVHRMHSQAQVVTSLARYCRTYREETRQWMYGFHVVVNIVNRVESCMAKGCGDEATES